MHHFASKVNRYFDTIFNNFSSEVHNVTRLTMTLDKVRKLQDAIENLDLSLSQRDYREPIKPFLKAKLSCLAKTVGFELESTYSDVIDKYLPDPVFEASFFSHNQACELAFYEGILEALEELETASAPEHENTWPLSSCPSRVSHATNEPEAAASS